jgi:hypothetical protein
MVKKGKTPVWSREDAKVLLDSLLKDSVSGYHNGARRRLTNTLWPQAFIAGNTCSKALLRLERR